VGERLTAVFAPLRRSVVLNEAKWCGVDVLNNAIRCGLVVLYVWLAYRHTAGVMLGSAVMVYQYAQQVGGVVSNMAGNYHDLVCYETDLAGAEPLVAAADAYARPRGEVPAGWREIAVDGLNFSYIGPRGEAAIDDVSLRLARGRRIAVVGESGSGKSTLLRVLAGLYPAQDGTFVVDGAPCPGLVDLASIATLVPQDPEIFAGTIGHNITLGLDRSIAEIHRACELAGFTPVLEQLPEGLATDIAQRGLNLSGGQKQRLALARGILAASGSSVLMLDEPTSSLDPTTEALVYDNLLSAFPETCVVSSVHRLHLLNRFDEVVLMAEGRILAIGTAAELLAREPLFQALWQRYGAAEPIAA
jgi:ABC-type bacteriocin/lantibiotic exporter with double-glycine peptidase domain